MLHCKVFCESASIIQDITGVPTEGYAPFFFGEDGDVLPFRFTQESFLRVLSALQVGAQIAYGDEGRQVVWDFLVNVEFPMPICEMIIDCIQNDADVKAALRDFIVTDDAINQHVTNIAAAQALSLAQRLTNLLKPDQCDPDYVFNQCSVLVQLVHDLSEDMFEALEVASNQLERADILVSAVPAAGFNDTAATVFRAADQIAEEIAEDYSGAYDEALYDTIRCKIFCACKDDCTLTIDKAIEVYTVLLGDAVPSDPFDAFIAIMGFIAAGDFGTDVPVYLMHLFALTAIRLSQNVFGIDFGILANRLLAAGDDPDNDWEILCEDCPAPPDTPNIVFSGTYAPDYDGTPKTFVANTETGGSIWEITCQDISGVSAAAITMFEADGVSNTCVYITAAEGVTSYQHDRTCTGQPQESGSGAGNPTTIYGPRLGFFGTGVITVTFEPAP